MAEVKGEFLAPPVLAQIRNEEQGARMRMERSFSQEIRDERHDLKEAAEHSSNVILELSLDGSVRWVSASWKNVVGTDADEIQGKPISTLLIADQEGDPFAEAVASMQADDSKSHIIHFRTRIGPASIFFQPKSAEAPEKTAENLPRDQAGGLATEAGTGSKDSAPDEEEEGDEEKDIVTLEGQGIMVYHRASGEQSHTMWMLRPAVEPREITIDLPEVLVESLGFGAEVLANYLTAITDENVEDPADCPPMTPILCRICERQIIPWWFEKHSDLCLQENKAESEVQQAHEGLMDQRKSIEKVLDALSAARPPRSGDPSPSPTPVAEYKGLAIAPLSSSSSGSNSGRASPATPPRSRDTSQPGFSHSRARSFTVRRPVRHIVELLIDLCDTALEIKTPALITDNRQGFDGEFRTQTPTSETRISQVLNFQTPGNNILEAEQGLALLASDTETLAREKIEATMRHRQIIEYSERIRIEFHVLVQDCIEAAIRKAKNIREGRDSSSESEAEDDELDTALPNDVPETHSEVRDSIAKSMEHALQGMADMNLDIKAMRRRSVAISTGSNSPMECPTPRSHAIVAGALARSQSIGKRSSLYAASDAGDSDGSLSSSMIASSQRTDSPTQEHLSRSRSSRDPKRRSLKLPAVSNSPHRHPSPGNASANVPQSPMRIPRERLPSGSLVGPSPIASPMMTSGDPGSPIDHRRQSSVMSTDGSRLPPSPRLNAINQQPKAVPPSIKDFEIIKPISRGAFGSVYLSKKKATGDYFAIKVLRKADMVAKNQITNIKAERAIMMWQGESDFVAKLYWTFSSKDFLYLVMEYLNGGDCASLIKSLGGLPEPWAKKYLAEVLLGVEHLHSRGVVHRDLKPDNLLIDQNGHLKLTDFGLSRMGLVGRQKRLAKSPNNSVPDLLKSGPFVRAQSMGSSRSASFDFPHHGSPANTPSMVPDASGSLGQPSYFSLARESSMGAHHSRRASGYRSDSGSSDTFHAMFKNMSLDEPTPRGAPIEEENLEAMYSPDIFPLQLSSSQANLPTSGTPPQSGMLQPPPMALYDPEDQNRRFVGTPDYLAPETINGLGQDESSDWWSCGCILYEFLYGIPPFHAETPEKVFENILARNIEWPPEDETEVTQEARDIMDKLITTDTKARLGSNASEKYKTGGEEIRAHPWFDGINWETIFEDAAQFVPQPENPEDTEYFDSRGATLQTFAEELEDQSSSPAPTPGADYQERPHDALSGLRRQVNGSVKRTLMPLHIPAHVRENRSRRLSEPVANDDFGSFAFKNLPVLEKANKDVIQKLRAEALKEQPKKSSGDGQASGNNSPAPSVESSPLLPSPLKRTLSTQRGSSKPPLPSNLAAAAASPSRMSQPTSPLLLQFSAGPNHERRKTSGSSSASMSNLQNPPGSAQGLSTPASLPSQTSSPIRASRPLSSVALHSPDASFAPIRSRHRSQTVGSQEESLSPKPLRNHYKRRSQVLDVSPSSSDNEDTRAKALLRVQRRRQSSRRLSQFSLADGPCFRPLDVLLCEDHPVSRMVMERLFEKLRCRTISVTTGPEAVRFATSEVQFDVIMMEVKLPQLNGPDVARMIRGTKNANQNTPIVAVTGYLKELPQNHSFDELIEKPATADKLTQTLCRLCSWKAPPPDWHPGPQQHVPSSLRQEAHVTEDSPSSQSSGPFGQNPGASYRASSREDSLASSGFFGDMETDSHAGSGVVITDAGDDWDGHGLGISEDGVDSQVFTHPGLPHLLHFNSAPPILDITLPSPRKAPSSEAIRAKKEMHERNRHECIESGDDEDEELGGGVATLSKSNSNVRSSKLSTQMMRANSRGSIVSGDETGEPGMHLPPPTSTPERARHSTMDEGRTAVAPPLQLLPLAPGHLIREIDMDATPRPPANAPAPDDTVTPKALQIPAKDFDTSPSPAPALQRKAVAAKDAA